MKTKSGSSFDDRKREILAAIVKVHIATGQPVGSFALAQKSSERLSSATIRNICAELEDEGYLTHPHTSAGRVPTDSGYRRYVDLLLESGQAPGDTRVELELSRLRREVDEAMRETTAALAQDRKSVV